jgi:hypothetical protein
MKLHPRSGSLLLARLRQTLRSLQSALGLDPSQPALFLSPIPIRGDRPVRRPASRLPWRGD